MRRLVASLVFVCALTGIANSEPSADEGTEPVVVVNAAAELDAEQAAGQLDKLRRALEARGLLHPLPARIEEALEGHAAIAVDLEAVKDAWASFDYEGALELIDEQEGFVLDGAVVGDPAMALAELTQWRGLIASAQHDEDTAIVWFQAAYRLNPGLTIDKRYASPRVRQLVKRARRAATEESGALAIEADPEDAEVSVDGGEARPIKKKLRLEPGVHLVMITAEGRAPYAELVWIRAGATERLEISLDAETKAQEAARLVDATAAAAPGKARRKRAGALARVTGAKRILVVEEGDDDHVTVRLYDVGARRVSKPLELSGRASSASIARMVSAALEGDPSMFASEGGSAASKPWYKRWYVWAGVAAVAAGGILYTTTRPEEPTSISGF
jgi:tetratricopeptide (TPR) repeat protein